MKLETPVGDQPAEVMVVLPLAEPPRLPGCPSNVYVRLTAGQARTAARMVEGLRRKSTLLANGRYVNNTVDMIRFLIENVQREFENGREPGRTAADGDGQGVRRERARGRGQ